MLAPRASSAFVCIRCQLRQARPRLPALPLRPRHAIFSTSIRRRDAFDEAAAQSEIPKARKPVSERPLGRIRKRKGKAIRETTARLGGVKTLGDDAEILVLTEVGDDAPQEQSEAPEIISEPQEGPNILDTLKQEGPVTAEEAIKQLNSLRPKTHADPDEPHYVTQSTFFKLAKTLLAGFTVQQLSSYYSVTKGVEHGRVQKEVLDGLKRARGAAKRPIDRSDWHPGSTQINRRLPGLDVSHRPKRKPVSKQLLVDQILRDVWKLVLLEEIEAPGELELSLKPWQLALLSSGATPTPLDRIGRDRKAKLQIYWPHNTLRITADKNTAEYAANDVDQLLQSTKSERFHLKPWLPHLDETKILGALKTLFTPKSLQTVAAMTGAGVQVVSDDVLMLRGLDETSMQEARRCLTRMLPLKDPVTSTVDTARLDAASDQSYLLPVTFERDSLDYVSRQQQLGRWLLPVGRSRDSAEDKDCSPEQSELADLGAIQARILDMVQGSQDLAPKTTPQQRGELKHSPWAVRLEDKFSAEFGQLLFPFSDGPVDSAASPRPTLLKVLPGFSKTFTDGAFQAGHRFPPSLEYDFVPAPEQANFKKDQQYPSVHVQFKHDNGKPHMRKLNLGFGEHVHDVLLPDHAVDIRFKRSTRLQMQDFSRYEKVSEFVSAVVANIQSGERLSAPSLELEIPKWAIPGYNHSDLFGTRTVKYLFTGIRFRQSVPFTFGNTIAVYSTVQSGKLGRRGGSLSAYFDPNSGKRAGGYVGLTEETKMKEFVQNCFKIAERITKATNSNQSAQRVLRPRDEMSVRKMRREGQFGAGEALDDRVEVRDHMNERVDGMTASETEGADASIETPLIDGGKIEAELDEIVSEDTERAMDLDEADTPSLQLADVGETATGDLPTTDPHHENSAPLTQMTEEQALRSEAPESPEPERIVDSVSVPFATTGFNVVDRHADTEEHDDERVLKSSD